MLTNLTPQPEDKILALMAQYRADPRPVKIDLGVGVYKNAEGLTPVMRSVKDAEHKLWQDQDSKSYVGLAGDPAFSAAMRELIFGDSVNVDQVSAVATPGGTGAIRQGFELVKLANTGATVWLSDPTWPNHPSILSHLELPQATYRYFDAESCTVDLPAMLEDLAQVKKGDVVLLHGCCHNPTGANLKPSEFDMVIDTVNAAGAIPFVDIAYQGFGDGLEADAAFTRAIAARCPQFLVAASCSKNFGIYRERTGVLFAVSDDTENHAVTQSTLSYLNRQNFSFPPDHGARLVTMILNDDKMRGDWQAELEDTRIGMLGLRAQLADALRVETGTDRFDFVGEHRGMFSRLGIPPEAVAKLREEHAIYMVGDSRINIAGLNKDSVPILAKSIAKVI